jgi:hypothetical protein
MIQISFLVTAEVLESVVADEISSSEDDDDDEYIQTTRKAFDSTHSISGTDPKGKKRSKNKDAPSVKRLKSTSNDPKNLIDCEEIRADLSQQSVLMKQLLRQMSHQRQQLSELQLCHTRREKTQVEILKNQRKLAKAFNNREVRSVCVRNPSVSFFSFTDPNLTG